MALSKNKEKRERQLANLNKFKPGQSGNPSGRPRKLPITEALQAILGDPETAREYVIEAIKHAKKGSGTHFKEINDRVEGSVNQKHELTGEDGGPIEISIKVIKTNAKGAD